LRRDGDVKQFAFSGPGQISTDAGVEKDTKVREGMSFNLRIEMFNVFNHANFTGVTGNANSGAQFVRPLTLPWSYWSSKRQVHLLASFDCCTWQAVFGCERFWVFFPFSFAPEI